MNEINYKLARQRVIARNRKRRMEKLVKDAGELVGTVALFGMFYVLTVMVFCL